MRRLVESGVGAYTRDPMNSVRRFTAPVAGLLTAVILVACGSQTVPITTPAAPAATDSPMVDLAARDAFGAAICPIFDGILEVDPRLAAMREAGSAGGDMSAQAAEIGAVNGELLGLLNALEALPEWDSGTGLRFHLISSLHGIRAHLLAMGEDAASTTAAEELAALPFIATNAMERAMQDAVDAGLNCEGTP
jgi:hypothetical protein